MRVNLNFFILCFFLIFSFKSFSQHDAKSKPILDAVTVQMKSFSSYKADFVYTLENKEQKVSENKAGTLIVKGTKYKADFAGQVVYCNGKNLYIYIKDANEVQIKDMQTDADAITPTTIFTLWQKGFKSKFIKEELYNGITCDFIDLVPLKGKSYYKVRLIIDKNKKQVSSITIYEKKGSAFTYRISKFVPNVPVNDTVFTFKKSDHPKVEEVDMR
ncbi:MAG: outer membrane lipoprotein carrier protein LolA [Bacteroidota bacterium]|nr:outer membrane lipoprotein carrier protein LolA [Bacteroidota bacterium]